jgi:beta-hydroxylase
VGEDPNMYAPGRIQRLISAVERINARHSCFGNPPVYDTRHFPWVAELEAEWKAIRRELDHVLEDVQRLPAFHEITSEVSPITTDQDWKTFFLAGYGMRSERNARVCPETTRLLRRIPGLKTAFFSILAPGKKIRVHKGPYNGVLRYHLALKVPKQRERCRLWIEGREFAWEEGKSFIFDDTFNHAVANDTDEFRAVLFADFVRPIHFPYSLANGAVLAVAPHMGVLREARRNHEAWEKEFYGAGLGVGKTSPGRRDRAR